MGVGLTDHGLAHGMQLVVASHNMGKIREFAALFAPYGLSIISAADLKLAEPDETEMTFEGNARLKAIAAAEASGLPALADDSGLEVSVLDGAPGIFSARWAGDAKDFGAAMRKVRDLALDRGGWKDDGPRADFLCVLCLAWPDGHVRIFEGRVDGVLVWPPRGNNGFGYDSFFQPDGATLTFGEMDSDAKHAISHRARAFAALIEGMFDGCQS